MRPQHDEKNQFTRFGETSEIGENFMELRKHINKRSAGTAKNELRNKSK